MRYRLGRVLGWLGVVWMGGLLLVLAAGIAIEYWKSGMLDATVRVMQWFSPFNVKGWALTMLLAAPGGLLLWAGSKLAPENENST